MRLGSLKIDKIGELVLILTTACNSRCQGCSYWKEVSEEASLDELIEDVSNLKNVKLRNLMLTGGEPLLYTNFDKLIHVLRPSFPFVRVATNGSLLDEISPKTIGAIDLMTISLDSATATTYLKTRRVDFFDKILNGIEKMLKLGKEIKLSFLLQQSNYHELFDFFDLVRQLEISSASLLLPDYRSLFGADYIPLNEVDYFLPNSDAIQSIQHQLKGVQELCRSSSIKCNFTSREIEQLPSYLESLVSQNRPIDIRKQKCCLPANTLVRYPDGSFNCCYYFPERYRGESGLDANYPELAALRGNYYLDSTLFNKRCAACVQSCLSET